MTKRDSIVLLPCKAFRQVGGFCFFRNWAIRDFTSITDFLKKTGIPALSDRIALSNPIACDY